jgi:uncharacterized protein
VSLTALPMFPLQSTQLPGDVLPLRIFEPRYARMIRDCVAAEPVFGVVLISRGWEVGGGDVRSDVGALARIVDYLQTGDGEYELLATIGDRIRVSHWLPDDPYPRANVEPWPDEPGPAVGPERIGAVAERIAALYERVAAARGLQVQPETLTVGPDITADPARHLYALAAQIPIGQADRYDILAAPTLAARVDALTDAVETVMAMVEFQLSEE